MPRVISTSVPGAGFGTRPCAAWPVAVALDIARYALYSALFQGCGEELSMYAEELFTHLDKAFGQEWRTRIESEDVKGAIDKWIAGQVGRAVARAIDNLSEEH